MSEPIKIGNTPFYDFSNGDLRRAFTTTVNITHVLSEESKPPLLFDPAKLDIGALKDQPMSVSCPYPVLQWYSFSAEQEQRDQQEPMTLERAVEILNERKHRGINKWAICKSVPETHPATSELYPQGNITSFEAIAIAEKLLREGK